MTVAAFSTNMTDLYAGVGSTTNWSALGGGQSGLNAETDYFIQGTGCTSKNAFASAKKGMIFDASSDRASLIGTDGAFLVWLTQATPNSLDLIANGGIDMLVGSAVGAYKHWYVGGSDTIEFLGWVLAAVNPSETTDEADTGSPSSVEQFIGVLFDLPSGGPTKGAPNAVDAIRAGRCDLVYEHGTSADPDASFDLAVADKGDVTDRLGLIQEVNGALYMSGLHQLGSASNAVEFTAADKSVFWRDHPAVTAPFNTLEILNASSIINMLNFTWAPLGTKSPGTWVTTDDAEVNLTGMTFPDWASFLFDADTTIIGTTFRRCGQITLGGATATGCKFDQSPAASAVLAATPAGAALVSDAVFTSDGNGNGLEISGSVSNITLTDIDFNGYSTSVDADKAIYVNIATGTITINISGGSGVTAASHVRTAGATVIVTADVSITFDKMRDDTEVRVYENTTVAATDISFTAADTIASAASEFGVFAVGDEITVRGSDLNDGSYKILTASASTLTIQAASILTESAGASISIKKTNQVEIDGIEDVTAGSPDDRSFTWASPAATVVDYVIHHFSGGAPFFQTIRVNGFVVPGANVTININQLVNRNAS